MYDSRSGEKCERSFLNAIVPIVDFVHMEQLYCGIPDCIYQVWSSDRYISRQRIVSEKQWLADCTDKTTYSFMECFALGPHLSEPKVQADSSKQNLVMLE